MNVLKNYFINIILIFTSTIAILVFVEIYIRLYYDDGKVYELEMLKYASKLKYQVKTKEKFYLAHYPNKEEKIMGAKIIINSNGYRDNLEGINKKNKVLMMGDSMTFGFGSSVTFSSILDKNLDNFSIINAGVGNTNTVMQVDSFFDKDYLQNPDIIILNFFINDLEEISYQHKKFFNNFYLYNLLKYKFYIIKLNKKK